MTTLTTNDRRHWNVVENKVVNGISVNLVHANVLPEAMPYADWGLVVVKGDITRFQETKSETEAREKFSSIK